MTTIHLVPINHGSYRATAKFKGTAHVTYGSDPADVLRSMMSIFLASGGPFSLTVIDDAFVDDKATEALWKLASIGPENIIDQPASNS